LAACPKQVGQFLLGNMTTHSPARDISDQLNEIYYMYHGTDTACNTAMPSSSVWRSLTDHVRNPNATETAAGLKTLRHQAHYGVSRMMCCKNRHKDIDIELMITDLSF